MLVLLLLPFILAVPFTAMLMLGALVDIIAKVIKLPEEAVCQLLAFLIVGSIVLATVLHE
jgi:hypothetical protein